MSDWGHYVELCEIAGEKTAPFGKWWDHYKKLRDIINPDADPLEDNAYSMKDSRRWYPWAREVLRDMKPSDRRLIAMLAFGEPEWAAA